MLMLMLMFSVALFAEMKIGYINSEKIMAEFSEAVKARETLAKWQQGKEDEARKMEEELKKLDDEVKNMSVMISEEKKKEMLAKGQQKLQEFYAFKNRIWGQQGEFFQEQQKVMEPVMKKVNDVIKSVSEKEEFDVVFDANVGALLYAKPEYDITDNILKELNK